MGGGVLGQSAEATAVAAEMRQEGRPCALLTQDVTMAPVGSFPNHTSWDVHNVKSRRQGAQSLRAGGWWRDVLRVLDAKVLPMYQATIQMTDPHPQGSSGLCRRESGSVLL